MIQDSNTFKSVLKMKCPKCHEGDLFCNKTIYKYKGYFDMPNYCPNCEQSFRIESGFYLGAMFVSYGLTIALNVAVFVAFLTFDAYSLFPFLVGATIATLLAMPYMMKISRSIWIATAVKYDPNAIKDYAARNNSK